MRRIIIAFMLSLAATMAFSQTLDGSAGSGEYRWTEAKGDLTVWARLSADGSTLHVAVRAKTAGWVAIGLGSPRMDGSFMIFGYVSGGVESVTEETGKGHAHTVNPARIALARVVEADGFTTLEATLPAGSFVKAGKLNLIAAWGRRDDRTSMHAGRAAFVAML